MIETDNIFTEIVLELQEEMANLREKRDEAIPFMKQKLSPAAVRKNLDSLPPGERKAMAADLGTENVLKLIRGK